MAGERFWDFSGRVYGLEGVSDACLALQDGHGADVNLMLFCCWAGANRGVVSRAKMSEALDYSSRWADRVVRPLRNVRRWMKTEHGESELRDDIKRVELAAERVQQEALEKMLEGTTVCGDDVGPGADAVRENLLRWLEATEIDLDDTGRQSLELIVQASCRGRG